MTDSIHRDLSDVMDKAVAIYGPGCAVELRLWSRSPDDDRRWSCTAMDPEHAEVAAAFRVSADNAVAACLEQLEMRARGLEFEF